VVKLTQGGAQEGAVVRSAEATERLNEHGLSPGGRKITGSWVRVMIYRARNRDLVGVREACKAMLRELGEHMREEAEVARNPDAQPIAELCLPERVHIALVKAKVETIGQLRFLVSTDALESLPNVGEVSDGVVRRYLARFDAHCAVVRERIEKKETRDLATATED